MTLSPADALSRHLPRTALITGGAARLGRAIVLALAEAGFAVAVHHRNSESEAAATAAGVAGSPASEVARASVTGGAVSMRLVRPARGTGDSTSL
jgi:NAD(P)-dependent dehydrogenase (short-subunit alcohol dehydrogenase family)